MEKKKNEKVTKLLAVLFVMVAAVMTLAPAAQAFVTPIAGSAGYGVYNIGFVQFLQGAIGYLIAGGLAAYAFIYQLPTRDTGGAMYSLGAAAGVGGLQGILTSFGAIC